jgi:hypothetical protein
MRVAALCKQRFTRKFDDTDMDYLQFTEPSTSLYRMKHPRPEQIELCTSVHLPFD